MPAAIDASVGGPSANSYVTEAEADTYFGGRLNAGAWTSGGASRVPALIQAARRLDQETYRGCPVKPRIGAAGETQALQWPRYGVTDEGGRTYLTTAVPQVLKDAQCELALAYLVGGTSDAFADSGLEAFEKVKIGPLEVTPRATRAAGELPEVVQRLLRHVLANTRHSVRLVRS